MKYPVPEIPKELFGKKLDFLDMCTYGITKIDHSEAFINEYANKSGQGCNGIMQYLGFTAEESKMFIQFMYPLDRIVNKRRKLILEALNNKSSGLTL